MNKWLQWCFFPMLLLSASAGLQSPCPACSVPVFRYALEKWQPDNYEAILLLRGAPTAGQQALIERLQAETLTGQSLANVQLTMINPDQDLPVDLLPADDPLLQSAEPVLVVRTPLRQGPPLIVWAGTLTAESVEQLLDSPLRRQLAERILKGDSVVWVLLEGSNPAQNDQAFQLLNSELQRLQKSLKLPELAAEDVESLGIESGSLKLAFSAVRVSRTDPADAVLVNMLLRVEPDLLDDEYQGLPMAFPIFGRGRALHALVGAGINGELIEDACRFLTGACQCTVKAENPGVDLLMAVDWEGLVQPTADKVTPLPPLAGLTGFGTPAEAGADTPAATAAQASGTAASEPSVAAGGDAQKATQVESAAGATVAQQPSSAEVALAAAPDAASADVPDVPAVQIPVVAPPAGSGIGRSALLMIVALAVGVLLISLLVSRQNA